MNVVLCGMPASGKTSVGKKLCFLTGRKCLDTDKLIEEKHGKISDIFATRGEGYFRDLESALARDLENEDGLVLSTGGGFVLRQENAERLKKNGKIVYLRATLTTLVARANGNKDGVRPLLNGGAAERLKKLLADRAPIYERAADLVVDTDDKSVTAVAEEIISRLGERL